MCEEEEQAICVPVGGDVCCVMGLAALWRAANAACFILGCTGGGCDA
jgi:hypothetical protein